MPDYQFITTDENGKDVVLHRGRNYVCKPDYFLPAEFSYKILVLMIVAQFIRPVTYKHILPEFHLWCTAEKSYFMVAHNLKKLTDNGDIHRIARGYYEMRPKGWKKLAYYDKKYGLPKMYREPIKEELEEWKKEIPI